MFKHSFRIINQLQGASPGYAMRHFSVTSIRNESHDCKFLVVGGGSGGCAMASKLTNEFGPNKVIVLEPNDLHYYQPLFTMIGGGLKQFKSSHQQMGDVLPKKSKWIKDWASSFDPSANRVTSQNGHVINYEYMIISTGVQLNYDAIPGLEEAIDDDESNVCSIYSPKYVKKTWECIRNFKGGEAIFTYPATPIKCPGAPQKIMYLAEENFRHRKIRNNVNITYNSSLDVIFSVKKYADALWEVVKERNINVNLRRNLIEVKPKSKEAIFQNLDNLDEKFTFKYDLLHVTPPMGPSKMLLNAKSLTNPAGFIDVNKSTMQHTKFPNIFALGDCTNTTNPKTAASVAAQSQVLQRNLSNLINNKPLDATYIGYASCPLITSSKKCIMAEFDYDFKPLETFPINQGKERYSMFYINKHGIPLLYWSLMTKGYWNGPQWMRKILNPFKFN